MNMVGTEVTENPYGRALEDVPVPAGWMIAAELCLRRPIRGEWYISPWDGVALRSNGEPGAGSDHRRIIIRRITPSIAAKRGPQPFAVYRDIIPSH